MNVYYNHVDSCKTFCVVYPQKEVLNKLNYVENQTDDDLFYIQIQHKYWNIKLIWTQNNH